MARVAVANLTKTFGTEEAIKDISVEFEAGRFTVLVGPSGCGKSTLLRLIAGLERADAGDIDIGDRRVNDLPPADRRIAMVFQSYALYPHMTVYRNMAFGLKLAGKASGDVDQRVREAARILQLEDLLQRKPAHLSGGQRQRVAIGRAIVREPDVFLFDEPLSNLDAGLRASTRVELARLHRLLEATTIYVTHDQMEAMTLADRIVVMNQGRIEQIGAPLEVYRKPANRFVAGFIGHPQMNFLGGEEAHRRGAHSVGCRPQHISVSRRKKALLGRVLVTENLGNEAFVHVALESGPVLVAQTLPDEMPSPGESVALEFDDRHIHRFGPDGKALD